MKGLEVKGPVEVKGLGVNANVTIADCGDSALVAKAVGLDAEAAWRLVHALADALDAVHLTGVHDVVPTYDALLVEFDCTSTDHATVRSVLAHEAARLGPHPEPTAPPRHFVVPVVYGGEYGPDLPEVAARLGLTEGEVVDLHSGSDLTVRCLGAPRTKVAPGSVAVAGRQAVICPMPSPGGWPLLGRTPVRVLDLHSDPITAYRPGDTFRFRPIDPQQWNEYADLSLADCTDPVVRHG